MSARPRSVLNLPNGILERQSHRTFIYPPFGGSRADPFSNAPADSRRAGEGILICKAALQGGHELSQIPPIFCSLETSRSPVNKPKATLSWGVDRVLVTVRTVEVSREP